MGLDWAHLKLCQTGAAGFGLCWMFSQKAPCKLQVMKDRVGLVTMNGQFPNVLSYQTPCEASFLEQLFFSLFFFFHFFGDNRFIDS